MAGAVAYENLNFSLSKEKLAAVLDGETAALGRGKLELDSV